MTPGFHSQKEVKMFQNCFKALKAETVLFMLVQLLLGVRVS